jgi:hypothetical protein
MKLFWKLRLAFQSLLGALARPLGFNDRLVQFCDRCGMSGAQWPTWWAETSLWEKVAGNVNGHHHGCFCPRCFDDLAVVKGLRLQWTPQESNAVGSTFRKDVQP